MTSRNLFTALAVALAGSPDPGKPASPAPAMAKPADDDVLLNALRNSATGRDQIMQRRIGVLVGKPPS